ncbi:MAG: S8 family peptidase [candidate division Zixibacteria bacterium]|nr:S8 family peptidase [candidate division Zixibacteria bacterium]
MHHYKHSFFLLIFFLLTFSVSTVSQNLTEKKISKSLHNKINKSSSDYEHLIWIYFDENAVSDNVVALSEKSLKRRAKVDSENYLIDKNDYTIKPEIIEEMERTGVHIRHQSRWLRAVSAEANIDKIEQLSKMPIVKKISEVKVYSKTPIEMSPTGSKLYKGNKSLALNYGASLEQIQFIKALKLHQAGLSGEGVTIGIFDSGFNTEHPAFFDSLRVEASYDFINNDTIVGDPDCEEQSENNQQNYHGTLVMGVIAGFDLGNLIGVAYKASVVLAKTEITCSDTEIKLEEDNWVAAAEWADSVGVDIISSSVGYTVFTDLGSYTIDDLDGNTSLITIAADIAASKNILVISSAGNERNTTWGTISMPADGDSVIAVGAVSNSGEIAYFSSPGPSADGRIKPDIVTLGTSVFSSRAIGGYAYVAGTSFSSPLVAGACALALEHDQTLTAAEIRQKIIQSGDRYLSPDNDYGHGLFNAIDVADIIKFEMPQIVRIPMGNTETIHIKTSGTSNVTPQLTILGPMNGVILVDSGNGSGALKVTTLESNPLEFEIGLVADVGYFSDTSYINIEYYVDSEREIYAGPNPFSEIVRIFISPDAGDMKSITIFNSAGEKVWETVNDSQLNADIWEWNGNNSHNEEVADGAYLVLVKTDRTGKLLKLLKIR